MKLIVLSLLLNLFLGAASYADDRLSNEMPMYGGADKSHIQPNIDFSKSASQLGWDYLAKGDTDTAIKRLNQAWMFDHKNAAALWGFGAVMGMRAEQEEPIKNLKESVKFLKMAKSITPINARLTTDLAYSYILLGKELQAQNQNPEEEYSSAYHLLNEAKAIQPDLSITYFYFSLLEFYKGNYSKAKDFLNKADSLGFVVDQSYNKALNEKL